MRSIVEVATPLEHAILHTIQYFSVLSMPLTATQIWQLLVVQGVPSGLRITSEGTHHEYHLEEIHTVLKESEFLRKHIETKWGYYFLIGQEGTVRERLTRHSLAQQKWKIAKRAARWLAAMPFVSGLAGSGSLAIDNTKPSSDLDIFVIVHPKRIWTVRLGLLLISELLGRRRRYWHVKAPDQLCLNHYISQAAMQISPDIQSLYTAALYSQLVPLWNKDQVRRFQLVNESWMKQYVLTPPPIEGSHLYTIILSSFSRRIKYFFEQFLLEPLGVGTLVEKTAEVLQRRVVARHRKVGTSGRVVLSDQELAFHPGSKASDILHVYTNLSGNPASNSQK